MKGTIFLSGEIQGDVGDEYHVASNEVEAAINSGTDVPTYGGGFGGLFLVPIILPEDNPVYHEVRRYTTKDRVFEFRLKISHAAFKAADAVGHRKLLVEMILRAVDEARKKKIKDIDYDKLEADIRRVAASKGWL